MSANYQEDSLIAGIDLARQGLTPEILSENHFDLLQFNSFYNREIEVCFRIAEMSLGKTDQELLLQSGGIAIRVAIEKRALRRILAENGVDLQTARALFKKHPVKITVEAKVNEIKLLRRQADNLKECLRSREFLREQPKLLSLYLEARGIGSSRLPKVMRWLHAHYPEQ